MFARALVPAVLTVLISGDVARLGWDALGLWRFVFPHLWLFVLLEAGRSRRPIPDGTVFLAGAAMAMLYGGVYAKDLQHGAHPFGIDWLGSLCSIFDGGMATVLSLHVAALFWPRGEDKPAKAGMFTVGFLIFCLGAASAIYGIKTAFNFYRAERMLGPTWLVADILFAFAAWTLARRAWMSFGSDSETGRESWIWSLGAFAVWLPGARIIALVCVAAGLSDIALYFFVGVWAGGAAWIFQLLRRKRGGVGLVLISASRPAAAAALWRAGGALLLAASLGAGLNNFRAAGIFSAAIDWPSRALFAWAFLTSRLKV